MYTQEQKREKLKIINNILGTNFDLNSNMVDILEEIAQKWNSL